jgi:8-amino-7-oxononanoate synthase
LSGAAAKRGVPALRAALDHLSAAQLTRQRLTVEGFGDEGERSLRTAAGTLVDFSSNDYLGLARHPALAEAMAASARSRGAGSGASHLITGHGAEHAALEAELADFTQRERSLLFCSGYMANLAVMSAFAARGERVLLDRLSHASLIDGARLSGARLQRYPHGDAAACAALALQAGAPPALIATDGVFSMDGDLAPVRELAHIAASHGAWLAVDDAHGLGVVGEDGRGTLALAGLGAAEVPLLIGTLGKALGSCGAFVAGSAEIIEFLLQKARPYIYTTALPQPVAAASRAALHLVRTEPARREHLAHNVAGFRELANAAGLNLLPSATPIQPLLLGSAAAALGAQESLAREGYRVVAIRPPTVPAAGARLRITLAATHTQAEIAGLVGALRRALAGSL